MGYRIAGVLVGLGLVAWGISGAFHKITRTPLGSMLPVLSEVTLAPGLVDQSGASFDTSRLRGKVTVVNFIFTSCPSVCPQLTRLMGDIENRTRDRGPQIGFVSFSVDPETDSPARLRTYAEEYLVNLSRWSFVTGPRDALEKSLKDSFYVAMGAPSKEGGLLTIAHSEKFGLVDSEGKLRALQSVSSDAELETLIQLARELAAAPVAE